MANLCAIAICSNRAGRDNDKSFYRLPKVITHQGEETKPLAEERRKTRLARVSMADLHTEKQTDIRVCSDHSVSGKLAALLDTTNEEWAPLLYLRHGKFKVPACSSFDRYTRALIHEEKRTWMCRLAIQKGASE